MAITVNTNIASINAQRNLNRTQGGLNTSLARLSSGLRINSASDDAAGLAISEKLKSQIRSLSQAERNANDGVSLIQTAEGAMNEVSGILVRMRELAVQAGSDTVGNSERKFIDDERKQLGSEIDRIASVTEFNGTKLLDGSASSLTLQIGIQSSSNDRLTVSILSVQTSVIGGTTSLSSVDMTSVTGATSSLTTIDTAIADVSARRASLGATANRLQVSINNLATSRENLSAANSRIRDVDVASETASLTRSQILMQAGVSVLAQANQSSSLALNLLR